MQKILKEKSFSRVMEIETLIEIPELKSKVLAEAKAEAKAEGGVIHKKVNVEMEAVETKAVKAIAREDTAVITCKLPDTAVSVYQLAVWILVFNLSILLSMMPLISVHVVYFNRPHVARAVL